MTDEESAQLLIKYLDELNLANEEIVDIMNFYYEGEQLSREEAIDFVEYVRVKRAERKPH